MQQGEESRLRQIAWWWFRRLSGFELRDLTSGFRYYGRAAMELMASREATLLDYQDLGVWWLRDMSAWMGTTKELPMSALCHYDHNRCELLWVPRHQIELPDEAIGIHWYGGHTLSRKLEWDAGPGSHYPICQYARAVFPCAPQPTATSRLRDTSTASPRCARASRSCRRRCS